MTIENRIEKWSNDRLILDQPFNADVESLNILEELIEFNFDIESANAREIAKDMLTTMVTHGLVRDLKHTSLEDKVDALCDIKVFASGGIHKLGYDPDIAMDETLKEIESRKGTIQDGKFVKFMDKDSLKQRYSANYDKAKKPVLKEYDIWSEGFQVTGNDGQARHMGSCFARSFEHACKLVFTNDNYFNPDNMTYWGCKLYDNETEARNTYG